MNAQNVILLISPLSFLTETAISLFIINRVPAQRGYSPTPSHRMFFAFGIMLLGVAYLPNMYETSLVLRIVQRVFCFAIIIWSLKHPHISRTVYYALVVTVVHTAFMVFWTLPYTMENTQNLKLFGNEVIDALFIRVLLKESIFMAITVLFCRAFDFTPITESMKIRNATALIVLCSSMFIRFSLLSIADTVVPAVVSVYAGLMELFSVGLLIMVDKSQHIAFVQKILIAEESTTKYRLESIQSRARAEDNIRALHHDMKNHVIAVSHLLDSGDINSAKEYLTVLAGITSFYSRNNFNTGNSVVDGLLQQKSEEAEDCHIRMDINLHLEALKYSDYSSFAICTIVGNVLDNAFEAAVKVENQDERFVSLTSQEQSGYISITVANSYNGKTKKQGSDLLTTKDAASHGLGLSNVSKVIRKRGGNFTLDYSDKSVFKIILLFPIHDKEKKYEHESCNMRG